MKNNSKKENRIYLFDIARSICMVWIVGGWHLSEYCGIAIIKNNKLCYSITLGCLSAFFLMSGLLLSSKHITNKNDILNFYKKRFWRLYPLFLLSLTALFFMGGYINNIKEFVVSVFCLSSFLPPMPYTIWFAIMIIEFYVVSPVFLSNFELRKKTIMAIFVYIILQLENIFFGIFDSRLVLYFPLYILGLLLGNEKCILIIKNRFLFILSSITFLILAYVPFKNSFLTSIRGLTFAFSLFYLCYILQKIKWVKQTSIIIGYVSMTAYLFHRQIFDILQYFKGSHYEIWFALLVALPLCLLIAYFIQRLYNLSIKKIEY